MAGSRRDLTAMARAEASRPIKIAVEHGVVGRGSTFLDYGCGRGADVDWLASMGWRARGWDPLHRPSTRRTKSDAVALTYVVNVIEDPAERDEVLRTAWTLAARVLIVSARLEDERSDAHVRPRADGWMTNRGTFQRFFDHAELGEWIRGVVGVEPVPAAPGVWYVFRGSAAREEFLSRRYMIRTPAPRLRKSDAAFTEHREVLKELIDFFAAHGRLPVADELERAGEIVEAFGSIAKAFRVVEVVTDREEWLLLAERRRIDVLVYLALRFFDGEYRMADLPPSTRRDVRAHHQSLARATEAAQRLLFSVGQLDAVSMACRASSVGKLTPSALYVHRDALEHLPALLKIYEACARRLVGDVPGAGLVKLHRDSKKVSYLAYPDFDDDPHPALHRTDVVDLVAQTLHSRRYPQDRNVPILHRKEEFLHRGDPRWDGFRRVTEAEVAAGLYADPSSIGYRDQWEALIKQLRWKGAGEPATQ
jgi:DNA phosphorothioation-associated putative methyltransferase